MNKLNYTLFYDDGNPGFEDSKAAVLGVAFDKTESYGKGSAQSPAAIIRASHQVELEAPLVGETMPNEIHNLGIIEPKTSEEMVRETEALARKAFDAGKFFILLGGDHSVVNGLLGAVPTDVTFVNFDAHLDLRDEWTGTKLSQACVARRIYDKGFEQVWVGARDQISEEELEFIPEANLAEKIFYCKTQPEEYHGKHSFPAWMKEGNMVSCGMLEDEQVKRMLELIATDKVWLNIDIDCLDSREFPGTGTPMPFGLKLEALNELLFKLVQEKNVIGFNLVELIPNENDLHSQMTAAMLCYNIFNYWLERNK